MEAVRAFLSGLMEKNGMLTAVLSSQVISNVPAAVLLSSFTENWKALLLGTNLGGLGTPIASLASLISLKFYLKTEQADLKSYLLLFLSLNAGGCSFFWRLPVSFKQPDFIAELRLFQSARLEAIILFPSCCFQRTPQRRSSAY